MHRTRTDVEVEIVERDEALEALGEPACGERLGAGHARERFDVGGRKDVRRGFAVPAPPAADRRQQADTAQSEDEQQAVARQHLLEAPGREPTQRTHLLGCVRERGDEEEPCDGAERRRDTADDDCDEEREGEHGPVRRRVGDPRELDRERSRETGDRSRGRERSEPQPRDGDAERERGVGVLARRREREARRSARDDGERDDRQGQEHDAELVVRRRRQRPAKQFRLGEDEALGAARDTGERGQGEGDDPAQDPGAGGDEGTSQPAGRKPREHARRRGYDDGEQERRQERPASFRACDRLRKGPDSEKGALSERRDPRQADRVREPDRGHGQVDEGSEVGHAAGERQHAGRDQGGCDRHHRERRAEGPTGADVPARSGERPTRLLEDRRAHARPNAASERSER